MIWQLVSQLCKQKFSMDIQSIPNIQRTFSEGVRELDAQVGTETVERNKMLIARCHSFIQSFIQVSNRSNRMADRGDRLNTRMKDAQEEMNGLLQGHRPPPIDFTDKDESTISPFEINKKVKEIRRERREVPLLKIDNEIIIPKKKVSFKEEDVCKVSQFYIDNKIVFQGVDRSSLKIHSLILRNRWVDGQIGVFGETLAVKIGEVPVLLVAIYVNGTLTSKQIFNARATDEWVRFEPRKPIMVAGKVEKMEFLLFDHMNVPFFLGRTVKNPEKIPNVSIKDADMKGYVYMRIEGVKVGDHLQSENKRVEVLGTCGLCGKDEGGAECGFLNDGGKQNCAILSEDIDLPIVNYGSAPFVYFVA